MAFDSLLVENIKAVSIMALTTSNDCFCNSKTRKTIKLTCILRTFWLVSADCYHHRQVGPKKTPIATFLRQTYPARRQVEVSSVYYYTGSIFLIQGHQQSVCLFAFTPFTPQLRTNSFWPQFSYTLSYTLMNNLILQ